MAKKAAGQRRSTGKAEEKSYVLTTFRMSKRAVAEADTIKDALGLSTRTAAVQFALGQMYKALPTLSAYSADEVRAMLDGYLRELDERG